jgi:hypothetical protein
MLTTIFLAIYKKIIGKEEYFTKNIEDRIQQRIDKFSSMGFYSELKEG